MKSLIDIVKDYLPKRGRPTGGERVDSTRFSVTIPAADNKQLERLAAELDTSRHALAAALVAYGVEQLRKERKEYAAGMVR